MPKLEKDDIPSNLKMFRVSSHQMGDLFNIDSKLPELFMEKNPHYPTERDKNKNFEPKEYGKKCEIIIKKIFLSLEITKDLKMVDDIRFYDEEIQEKLSTSIPDGIMILNNRIDSVIEIKAAFGDLWEKPQLSHALQLLDGMICVSDKENGIDVRNGYLIYGKFDRENPSIKDYKLKIFKIKRDDFITKQIEQKKRNFIGYLIENKPPPLDTYKDEEEIIIDYEEILIQ